MHLRFVRRYYAILVLSQNLLLFQRIYCALLVLLRLLAFVFYASDFNLDRTQLLLQLLAFEFTIVFLLGQVEVLFSQQLQLFAFLKTFHG